MSNVQIGTFMAADWGNGMDLTAEILAQLRDRRGPDPLVYPSQGRKFQAGLRQALGVRFIQDRTAYPLARAYRLDCPTDTPHSDKWAYSLRVMISGVGPYATQVWVQGFRRDRWWSNAIRVRHTGFHPDHIEVLETLRQWYRVSNLTEVDPNVQMQDLPNDLQCWPLPLKVNNVFHGLFAT